MKPYLYSVQFISEVNNYEVNIQRGIKFGSTYTTIAKDIEDERLKNKESIVDLYIVAIDKESITLSEDTYEKLLNGETI